MKKLAAILTNVGLSSKEACVYLSLLELGEASPTKIACHAQLKRPTTYLILRSLESRGLISSAKHTKRITYRALNPYAFAEERMSHYDALRTHLPALTQLASSSLPTPQITMFKGKDGLRQVMEDTLTAKTEILAWANTTDFIGSVFKEYWKEYLKKRIKAGIWLRGVFSLDKHSLLFKQRGKEELREIYLIPSIQFPISNEINIYNDKVAIVSHREGVAVIIQSQAIADTQRSIFSLTFQSAKEIERKFFRENRN